MKEQYRSKVTADNPDCQRKIQIVPYNSTWPQLFEQQAARIRDALKEAALSIEHVGSTSVPGLAAKSVIDIHLAVQNSADEATYGLSLEEAGFRLMIREPDWFEHRMYIDLDPEINFHVFSEGCSELDRCRLFRDWLRIDQTDRAFYSQVKQALALQTWDHVNHYAEVTADIGKKRLTRSPRRQWRAVADGILCPAS